METESRLDFLRAGTREGWEEVFHDYTIFAWGVYDLDIKCPPKDSRIKRWAWGRYLDDGNSALMGGLIH